MKNEVHLKLDWATYESAKYACVNWHYSKTIPASKTVKIGVYEDNKFIGVILFSLGANNNIAKPFGLQSNQVCELTRIALREHVTPVSKILSIALKIYKKYCPLTKIIVSYADMGQDHYGGIYQAANWIYLGNKTKDKDLFFMKKKIHHRSVTNNYGSRSLEFLKKLDPNVKYLESKGKHKYIYVFDSELKMFYNKKSLPYPKKASIV